MLTVFVVGYATTKLGLAKSLMLDAVLYAALLELVSLPLFGWLADKIGRRPLYILGALFTIVFAFPLFWMVESKSTALIFTAVMIAMNFGHGMMFGPEILLLSRTVRPARALQRRLVRVSGFGGDRRRVRADHCHRDGRILRRHHRRVDHDDRSGADYPGGRTGGARDQGRVVDLDRMQGAPCGLAFSSMTASSRSILRPSACCRWRAGSRRRSRSAPSAPCRADCARQRAEGHGRFRDRRCAGLRSRHRHRRSRLDRTGARARDARLHPARSCLRPDCIGLHRRHDTGRKRRAE